MVTAIKQNSYVVEVEWDGEDFILPLPQTMLETLGWKPGDELIWEKMPGSAWSLRKKP